MTREEHLEKVEKLLAGTWERDVYVGRPPHHREPTAYAVALAQVHATLALAMTPKPEEPVSVAARLDPELVAAVEAIRAEAAHRSWWSRVISR